MTGSLVAIAVIAAVAGAPARAVASSPAPEHFIDPLRAVLGRFVRDGGVDYAALRREAHLLDDVTRALDGTGAAEVARWPEPDRIAFWINAYNALTLDLVVREWGARGGRLTTIREIPAAWTRPKWTAGGRSVTLDRIEHEILRGEFREPRIHFALVCASRSCPALRAAPYRGEFLDAQLDSAAREFVLDPARNDFTIQDGAIRISKIFDWYGKDFAGAYPDSALERLYGKDAGSALAYVARFLPVETAEALRAKRVRIVYLPYDWSLNLAPARR